MRKTILIVDDNITNLSACKNVLQDSHQVLTAPSGEKALMLLEKTSPDLILLDVEMPYMDGHETIKRIKTNKNTAQIPVIFLTAMKNAASEFDGLSLGAVDYIAKPFSPSLLKKRIEIHLLIVEQQHRLKDYNDNLQKMVEQKTQKIISLQDAVLSAVAELVEFRDGVTGVHIERTRQFLKALLIRMLRSGIYAAETAGWDIDLIIQSAQLHDVGKICIPDSILNKPGKLTEEEYDYMKIHTTRGKETIERISHKAGDGENAFLQQAAILAYSHHERWDGKGYPRGLAGEEIPLQGRLMALADVYDALISERPYKKPFSHEQAANIILDGAGTQFDPLLTQLFADTAENFLAISEGQCAC